MAGLGALGPIPDLSHTAVWRDKLAESIRTVFSDVTCEHSQICLILYTCQTFGDVRASAKKSDREPERLIGSTSLRTGGSDLAGWADRREPMALKTHGI